jgi:hypothetical protein
VFSAMPPNGVSYDGHLDRGSTDDKDTDKNRRSIGCRNCCAIRLCKWNIVELAGGLRVTWCMVINVCGAITL